jgi:phosphate transport system substrate-binding protein
MIMKKFFAAILCGSLAFSAVAGPSQEGGVKAGIKSYTIEIGGSTSVAPLMELLAAEYQKARPLVKININGTGSGDGIKNAGVLYRIGMSSRELTPAEQGRGLAEEVIAIDGIAVIVSPANPVNGLSIEQIRNIYTGAITDWAQVSGGAKRGKIAVVSREEGSGTRGAFEEIVGFQGKLLRGANESTSTGAIKAGIAGNPDAIGYISLGSLDNSVKALAVGGAEAAAANVLNGSYKIARPFIVLTKKNDLPAEAKAFLEWILGPDGQAVVKKSWIPVK